jgi:hypothetical protein
VKKQPTANPPSARAPRCALSPHRKKLIRNLSGKRNIRWNKSLKVRGNGIRGKGEEDKAILGARVACSFVILDK